MPDYILHIDYFAGESTCASEQCVSGLGSGAIDFGALDAYWSAISIDCDDRFEITSAQSIPAAPVSRGTTAKSCAGLTLVSSDGERCGRLAWVPGL